jgi:uncharacterized protein YbbC (DUF1343 family)
MITKSQRVKTGLDLLKEGQLKDLRNAKIALLGHPASVDGDLKHLYDICVYHDLKIVKLFGPEHGFFGSAQDMESVGNATFGPNNIPVVSLYGENRKSLMLDPALLKDVDVLICDLQDIGSRYYTFSYTIAFALQACAEAGVRCVVLDRPNPIGGRAVRGNLVKPAFQSFVGEYPLPIQHGLTMGELAHYFKQHDNLSVDLDVVWMQNWTRDQYFDSTGLPWVLPSPNMPNLDAAILYPGLCLIEGTNLSEGRGTTRPFELIGAPYIDDPHRFIELATQHGLEGAVLRPCWFKPMFQKHSEKMCGGVQIHITDRDALDPIRLATCLLLAAQEFKGFDWRRERYEFVSDRLAIDLLYGDDRPRHMIESRKSPDEVMSYLNADLQPFMKTRESLLHEGYSLLLRT